MRRYWDVALIPVCHVGVAFSAWDALVNWWVRTTTDAKDDAVDDRCTRVRASSCTDGSSLSPRVRSLSLEELARNMVRNEELHVSNVEKVAGDAYTG